MRYFKSWSMRWLLIVFATMFMLQGCGNQYAEKAKEARTQVNAKILKLGGILDSGQLTNAVLVKVYAKKLETLDPDLSVVTNALTKDATSHGNLYQGLLQRLENTKGDPRNKAEFVVIAEELQSLYAASDPVIFNDSLIDLVNTLADLSGGKLNRVNIPKDADVAHVKGGTGVVPGSYLVGNPTYGHWQQRSSGGSFWQFYGQYRFFTDIFSGPRYYGGRIGYSDWNSHSRYSYNRDYGRDMYGTSSDRARTSSLNQRMASKGVQPAKPKLKYGSAAGQKRRSNYSTMRNNFKNSISKKQGASGGTRHGKTTSRRQSSLVSGKKPAAKSQRSSSWFSSSARSSRRSSRGFGGFGGK